MADSKNSPRRVEAAERRTRALELRKEGKTFTAIGKELGCSEQRAHKLVTLELQRLNRRRAEQAAEVTRLEVERLDVLLGGVWAKAKAGDAAAIDRVLAIMGRRARLLGLDAPSKIAPTDPTGTRPATVRLTAAEMTDDDLARIASGGGGGDPASPAGA
jgi:hypothetical protein